MLVASLGALILMLPWLEVIVLLLTNEPLPALRLMSPLAVTTGGGPAQIGRNAGEAPPLSGETNGGKGDWRMFSTLPVVAASVSAPALVIFPKLVRLPPAVIDTSPCSLAILPLLLTFPPALIVIERSA